MYLYCHFPKKQRKGKREKRNAIPALERRRHYNLGQGIDWSPVKKKEQKVDGKGGVACVG